MGPVGLIMKVKNVVIDKICQMAREKKKNKRERKERQKKELDWALRMTVCHPEYSNSGLFILQFMDEDNSIYFHTFL